MHHRWRCRHGSTAGLTYVGEYDEQTRMLRALDALLRLMQWVPDIVEAIMDGRRSAELGLPALLKRFPVEWASQRTKSAKLNRPLEQ